MSKSKQTLETARAMVSPLFAWTNAVLKGGEMMLDSMQAAAKNAKATRVAVLPELEAPARRQSPQRKRRANSGRKAKRRA